MWSLARDHRTVRAGRRAISMAMVWRAVAVLIISLGSGRDAWLLLLSQDLTSARRCSRSFRRFPRPACRWGHGPTRHLRPAADHRPHVLGAVGAITIMLVLLNVARGSGPLPRGDGPVGIDQQDRRPYAIGEGYAARSHPDSRTFDDAPRGRGCRHPVLALTHQQRDALASVYRSRPIRTTQGCGWPETSGSVQLALNLFRSRASPSCGSSAWCATASAQAEDRFFATVFLGNGLLFVAMLFASAAMAGGIIVAYGASPAVPANSDAYGFYAPSR